MPERPLPWRVSAQNRGKTPLKQASSTHLPQLEGEAAYSERLEQTEMNFQIAPFFSQAPSYRFLGGGGGGGGDGTGHLETHLHAKHEACRIAAMEGLLGCQHKGRPQMVSPAARGRPSQPALLLGATTPGGSFPPMSRATPLLGQGQPSSAYRWWRGFP